MANAVLAYLHIILTNLFSLRMGFFLRCLQQNSANLHFSVKET